MSHASLNEDLALGTDSVIILFVERLEIHDSGSAFVRIFNCGRMRYHIKVSKVIVTKSLNCISSCLA
jgi:hypothetical protein